MWSLVLAAVKLGGGCKWVKDVKDVHRSMRAPRWKTSLAGDVGLVFGRGMVLHTPGWGHCEPSRGGGISQGGLSPAQPVPNLGLLVFQVSKAAADLMAYCEAHAKEDPLLTPVPASENPFREKKFFCVIL